MESPDLPVGVGPHEGRELALMLAGKKPLAMFSDIVPASGRIPEEIIPEEAFRPHVAAGRILMRVETYRDPAHRFVYYARPEEAWRLEAIHRINREIFTGLRKATEADDIEIGRLLGYADAEIRTFLDWKTVA